MDYFSSTDDRESDCTKDRRPANLFYDRLREEVRHQRPPTNRHASCARSVQGGFVPLSSIHSFITRPLRRGSKWEPAPDSTSSFTRSLGSFATNLSLTNMAKILPFTLSPTDAIIFPVVTRRFPA